MRRAASVTIVGACGTACAPIVSTLPDERDPGIAGRPLQIASERIGDPTLSKAILNGLVEYVEA